jgi:hypothetical protein
MTLPLESIIENLLRSEKFKFAHILPAAPLDKKFCIYSHFSVAFKPALPHNIALNAGAHVYAGLLKLWSFLIMEDYQYGKGKRSIGSSQQGPGLHKEQENDDLFGSNTCHQRQDLLHDRQGRRQG